MCSAYHTEDSFLLGVSSVEVTMEQYQLQPQCSAAQSPTYSLDSYKPPLPQHSSFPLQQFSEPAFRLEPGVATSQDRAPAFLQHPQFSGSDYTVRGGMKQDMEQAGSFGHQEYEQCYGEIIQIIQQPYHWYDRIIQRV